MRWETNVSDYIFLMHNDTAGGDEGWESYIERLQKRGCFQGGSAIGDGICARKSGKPEPVTTQLAGYIRVTADSLDQAKALLAGNPVYEAGGTVEIRELPQTAG
jgi:hypothetical protein